MNVCVFLRWREEKILHLSAFSVSRVIEIDDKHHEVVGWGFYEQYNNLSKTSETVWLRQPENDVSWWVSRYLRQQNKTKEANTERRERILSLWGNLDFRFCCIFHSNNNFSFADIILKDLEWFFSNIQLKVTCFKYETILFEIHFSFDNSLIR